jgi:hypothetical protein
MVARKFLVGLALRVTDKTMVSDTQNALQTGCPQPF